MKSKVGRITLVETDETGQTRALVLREGPKKKKKKNKGWMALPEKIFRQGLDAGVEFASSLRDSHEKSNDKKKDGWLSDLGRNVFKAANKGRKKVKMGRWFIAK
jgi:hypothetical protein